MPSDKEFKDATEISKKEVRAMTDEIEGAEEAVKAAVRSEGHEEIQPGEVAVATLAAVSATEGNDQDTNDFVHAVFIGWNGFNKDSEYFFPGIWPTRLAISKSGSLVPLEVEGVRVDPSQNPEFSHWTPVKIMAGDVVMIPRYNVKLYENAVATHEFATEEWADRVADWLDGNVDQRVILSRVEAGNGLLPSVVNPNVRMKAVTDQTGECEDCHSTWRPDSKTTSKNK